MNLKEKIKQILITNTEEPHKTCEKCLKHIDICVSQIMKEIKK